LNAIDKWIISRLSETISETTDLLEKYEYARACELMYHFAWDDLCDWYLELSKEAFASGNAEGSKRVLGYVLDQLFRLMHPVMPFITEQMWTTLTGGESLVIAQWPVANAAHVDKKAETLVAQLQEIITEVRRFRNDQDFAEDPGSHRGNRRYCSIRISGCFRSSHGARRHNS
jgi:valyl-tRNA synthetase